MQPTPLSLEECGALYRKAKTDGSLGGSRWPDFRIAKCGHQPPTAASSEIGTPAQRETQATSAPVQTAGIDPAVTFPTAISQAYSSETPARQRMRTCLENYHANKKAGTLSGLRWIQQGGGYYSLCNKRLKTSS